jgi:hypothetical protein
MTSQSDSGMPAGRSTGKRIAIAETGLIVLLFFVYAGDPPPAINEAHYLVLAKNFWQPDWCGGDLFAASNKPHVLFHATFGALTQWFSLGATAWIGRWIGWTMIAVALRRLVRVVSDRDYAILLVALIWIVGVERFNLAGEWVIGGIESKVPAYALVLAAMAQMAVGRWRWVWPLLGLASAFHVLVGGWAVVAAMVAYAANGRFRSPARDQILPLVIGGGIAMIGLVPGLRMSAADAPAESIQAATIYTYSRISHHLLPSSFPAHWYVRHASLAVVTLAVAWRFRRDARLAPLLWFAIGSGGIAIAGLLVGLLPAISPDLAARLLRYYWFRETDAILPLTLGLVVAAILRTDRWPGSGLSEPMPRSPLASGLGTPLGRRFDAAVLTAIVMVAITMFATSTIDNARRGIPVSCRFDQVTNRGAESYSEQREAFHDWLAVCDWVKRTMPEDEVLLTPRHQQTFKWYAERAEVANWKDVPQDAASLVQWHQRFFEIFPRRLGTVRVTVRYDDLRRYREKYGVDFMVVDRRVVGPSLPLVRVYPEADADDFADTNPDANATYAVYRLPQ